MALAVSPLQADRGPLRVIIAQGNRKLHEASDCCGVLALLRDQNVPVLLCERDHADGNWEDLLKATAGLPAPTEILSFARTEPADGSTLDSFVHSMPGSSRPQ